MEKEKKNNNEVKTFWRIFDPKCEVQLTRNTKSSPIFDEDGVQVKFDVTMEGEDEYRTRHFAYEEGELYTASFKNWGFPYISVFKFPEVLEEKIILVLGFKKDMKDAPVSKSSLRFELCDGANFYFDPIMDDKGNLKLKPVSFSISKEIGKIGEDILSWAEKRGSIFPAWYIREKIPEIF